ncbi:GAP family protein [Cryobacterium arcticum]|uniref:GAP family protein n=1 Tax=Cryobacterium arcticum TaxID=670052 RepID=A0A317ZXI6_9MICO|nr:GAP family protein [Cryobacterium arcticum]PXA71945.1 hypothetical protein CTB96_03255 [Cryobacterium arcticum]
MTDWMPLVPLALTIALSPLPVAALLMLVFSPHGFTSGAGFGIGWFVGVALATTGLAALSSLLPYTRSAEVGAFQVGVPLLLGSGLIVLGVLQWQRRPSQGTEVPMPRWMGVLGRLTPLRAALIGVGYAAFRPKNLAAAAAAGVIILGGATGPGAATVSFGVFTVVASLTMLGPVFAYAFGGRAVRSSLERLGEWLVRRMRVITTATTLVVGVVLVFAGGWALVVRVA